MPSAEEEGLSEKEQTARTGKLRERVQRLLVLFNGLSAADAKRIYDRLKVRKKGDVLSERFHDMLLTATRRALLAILERHVITTAPSLPLRADEMCGGQKCFSDEDLQMPQEAKGPHASYDLAPSLYPRKGSKELKKGRMEWVLHPTQGTSPAHIQITFTPKSSYRSHTVSFLQTLLEGEPDTIASQKTVMDFIRDKEESEPFYGADWDPGKKEWVAEGAPAGYKNAPSSTTEPSAYLYDEPVVYQGMTRIFESVAVIPETAEVLGSLRWGVFGNTILGAQNDDCTDLPSATFDALMTAYYSPRTDTGGGPEPEQFDTILDGYAADSFELSGPHEQQLKPVIKKFLDYPNKPNKTQIAVSGFGDAKDEDPTFTSEMRAVVVMRYLMDNGVPDINIDIHHFGAAWARFPAGDSEDRNRRVQVRTYYIK
jgi:outer membrane protein OmpA-like peptidoglycan-associated protein